MQNPQRGQWQRPPQGQGGPVPQSYIRSPDYLRQGYLDKRGNTRPELITTEAQRVVEELKYGLNYAQLRIFFAKIRYMEKRLRSGIPFEDIQADIASLKPFAAYAVTREVAPPVFQIFIDKNVDLAEKSEDNFLKGCVQHFQSIVCYFPRPRGQ